jgi:RNA polymerase sigma factor (sigma-70 family)
MGAGTVEFRRTSPTETRRSPDWLASHLRLAAAGDGRAWRELVEEFEGMLWSIVRGYRLCHADGGDVVQTTWLRLAENVERLRDPARLGAWLATTARRECLRTIRASRRELPDPEPPEATDREIPPLDGALIEAERNAALRSALQRLPARDQALLLMLVADSPPSYEEIGAALRMPIGSIGPTRGRALARLRGQLEHRDCLQDLAA